MTSSNGPYTQSLVADRPPEPGLATEDIHVSALPASLDRATPLLTNMPESRSRMLYRSQFARLFHKDGVNCVFHTLNLRMVFGGPILAELFNAFADKTTPQHIIDRYSPAYSASALERIITDLLHTGLLLADPHIDVRLYRRWYNRAMDQFPIQHLYLLPTSACNFRCTYCFVEDEGREHTPGLMDISTAELTVTTFARLTKESGHASVTIYGGEPLLNPKATFYSLRRLRQLEAEGKLAKVEYISILTNGSLIDDETTAVFRETRPTISISMDGPERLHDAARVDQQGRGTFASVIKGFRRLQDAGLKPGISCTLNAATLGQIDEIVGFIIDDLKPSGMGFNLLLPQTSMIKQGNGFDHEFAVQQLIKAFVRLRAAGIYEDRMMRRVRPFLSKQLHCKDCMGVGGQIVVTPAGRVGPCQAFLGVDDEKYFPLDIRNLAAKGEEASAADIYSDSLFGEWRQRFPLNMSACADCEAISVCGGGCPYASAVTHGSIWDVDERVCHQAKNILNWMVWDTYDHIDS